MTRIWAAPNVDHGAAFHFWLPIINQDEIREQEFWRPAVIALPGDP